MNKIFVKLKQRSTNKYRKVLSTDKAVFPKRNEFIDSTVSYAAETLLEKGEWFSVAEFSKKPYCIEAIIEQKLDSVNYDLLKKQELDKIDFLFIKMEEYIYFQNIPKSRLIKKKVIGNLGEGFQYNDDCHEIIINDCPDAVYEIETDKLLFRRLESITSIFRGIDELFREATAQEISDFLWNDFISLKGGYAADNIKTANRKRIALAIKTLDTLSQEDRNNIFSYIGDYCPNLKSTENCFEISSEEDLKLLLFGIEQRFYTTPVGEEKRLANSIISLT